MAEIVGIVASLVGPVIEVGKYVVVPIKRQFRYLCCFNSNIQYLKNEAQKLDLAKDGLQMQVAEAQNNGKLILPQVENWLTSSNQIQANVRGIEIDISNVQSGCLAIKSRYSLSKRADKTRKAIKRLQHHSKFDRIYVSPTPPAMGSVKIRLNYEFESRKKIEEDIMTSLRDEKINIIGLCGIGGVGKTTMAKRIMNRAREEHLFDEVVIVVVSQQKDMSKIQLECAESLGLKLEQQTLSARAHTLQVRLMSKKRILIVLDDIWSKLKLEDIGIPCENGCTILLTSRYRDVLSAMDVQKVCTVNILSETEAWFLFKEKVGTCVHDLNLVPIAEAVVNECGGLPIAIVTVGRALKDKKSKSIWEDALRKLRISNPIGLFDFLEEVYNPLKLSYELLDNPHAKSVFLLCSMFGEDENISLKQLTLYGWGLHMFEGVGNLEEATNNAYALTDMLKSRSLLLDGDDSDDDHVKMHDVIRDVAIFIASKEGRFNLNSSSILDWWRQHPHSDCSWISLYQQERGDFLSGLVFKNLRLLMINNSRETQYRICDQFFEETNGLNVLSISFSSLPQTTQLLKNLRTLFLYECTFNNISVIGKLSSLEILYCFHCDFKELPTEIGELKHLRLLEIDGCRTLKRIAPEALSQLVQLEELRIVCCFRKWDIARLRELECLSNLTCLEIEIQDSALAAEELCLSKRIVHYVIRIGEGGRDFLPLNIPKKRFEKRIYLDLQRRFTPRNWICTFLKNSERLYLKGYDSNNLDLSLSQNIERLLLRDCPTVKKLVSTTSASIDSRIDVFPFLKSLRLFQVTSLEEICDGPIPQGSNSFKNLEKIQVYGSPALKHLWQSPIQNVSLCNLSDITISDCHSMRSLFSLAIAKDCIPQLEWLDISSCKMMEQVLCNAENGTDEQSRHITFAKLKRVQLRDLERLTAFCEGIENIEFSLLREMHITECPNLKSLVSVDGHHNNDCFHLFCNQKVGLGNLRSLEMSGYNDATNVWCCQIPNSFFNGLERLKIDKFNQIESLFSSSIARSLVNLKYLKISDCEEMIQVIADDEQECDNQPPILLPNLEWLILKTLPKLESFCEWRSFALQLPSLKWVTIDNCFHMERFCFGSLTTPNLQRVQIDEDEIDVIEDLNDTLQKHIK